jgi:aerobic carbon-monoxide dehydrogenase medium subunit
MKPPPFEYHRAESVEEAVALLSELGDEAKVLAGGQSLVPLLSLRLARPSHLVDVNPVRALCEVSDADGLRLGATVRHRTIERSPVVRAANPLLADAACFIGHAAIRNRGTLGGSMAHADPAAELPTVLTVLGGAVEATSVRGTRTIEVDDFFLGFLMTALEPDELLTAVRFPALPAMTGCSFQEFSRRSGDFAVTAVAATLGLDASGNVARARIAFAGMAPASVRAREAEAALEGQAPSVQRFTEAGKQAVADLDPPDDLHGTADYRRHLGAVLATRALTEAYERAKEAA